MTLYLDSSALLKLYFAEPDSVEARRILASDPNWITACHTLVEVRRNLHRWLGGRRRVSALEQFRAQWRRIGVVEVDEPLCERAAALAEETGARTLDALHLGAAERVGHGALPFVTYDLRQAQAARSLGWTVLGAR